MKRLIIVGAGNLGREVACWAPGFLGYGTDWAVGGFLNDDVHALDQRNMPEKIIGTIRDYVPQPNDVFMLAIAEPRDKLMVARKLEERGAQFITLQHQTALLSRDVTLGVGSLVLPYVVISCNARVGRLATINLHSTVSHDSTMGEGCTLSQHCDVTGHVALGDGVFLGSHATVLPKLRVGDFARIGAGAVVIRDVEPGATVVGVPGRSLPPRDPATGQRPPG